MRRGFKSKIINLIFLSLLTALGLVAYASDRPQLAGEGNGAGLTVIVFDVGQGDAIFAQAPDGQQMLIDGGPDDAVLAKLGRLMPPGDREIDALVLTHPHADHVAGLVSVLRRYRVEKVLMAGVRHPTADYRIFLDEIARQGMVVEIIEKAENFEWGGARLAVLYPQKSFKDQIFQDVNASSVVLKLSQGEQDILLTGDLEAEGEQELVAAGADLEAEVLKAGHHGSKTSTSEEFLKAVDPEYAVISVGENSYGHPHFSVLHRLRNFGAQIFRTDEAGDVIIWTDGERLKITSDR
ncbi:MBL fold metallo-hydrolase [Candidatus Uhrbacteria bacterium]|nr:MBL fold metallo-hydrolase [Candidatus Uhrbacteria bacterium]